MRGLVHDDFPLLDGGEGVAGGNHSSEVGEELTTDTDDETAEESSEFLDVERTGGKNAYLLIMSLAERALKCKGSQGQLALPHCTAHFGLCGV